MSSKGNICDGCYHDLIYNTFLEYVGDELGKESTERMIKVCTADIGVLSNTHTRAYEVGLSFAVKNAIFSDTETMSLNYFKEYLEKEGHYKTKTEKVVDSLLQANFLKKTGVDGEYIPGDNALNFAKRLGYGGIPDREVLRQAYGVLNFTLMKNENKHSMVIKIILATAQDIIDKQKAEGQLTFDIHMGDVLRNARNIGLNVVTMNTNLERWTGMTPLGDAENTAFFDDIEFAMGYNWAPGGDSWDIILNMKKEWIQLRERLNSRMREV